MPTDITTYENALLSHIQDSAGQSHWREFDTHFRPIIQAYVRRQRLPRSDVDDVTQDIFVKLWLSIDKYDPSQGQFRTWLYQVARHAVIDFFRKEKRQDRAKDACRDASRVQLNHRSSTEPEDIEGQVLASTLNDVRNQSDAKHWACFERRHLKGQSVKAIAEDLDLNPNYVSVNICRTLKQVRASVEQSLANDTTEKGSPLANSKPV